MGFASKFFLRQLFISSGIWTCYFTLGLCLGYPTVLISQLRAEANSTEVVSEEMASWLPSLCVWAGIPWIFILSILTKYFGRKKLYILVSSTNCIGFIIFYCSQNLTHIVISAFFHGVNFGGYMIVNILIISECTSPKYRGLFLSLKSATNFWGIWVANTLGVYLHWKTIGILGILCTIYSLIVIFGLPESPYWLAETGKFDRSSTSYKWLMGTGDETEKMLGNMIEYHKQRIVNNENPQMLSISNLKNMCKVMKKREFYMPVILSVLLIALFLLSGKMVISVYAIEILTKVTGSKTSAQSAMLILDGVTVFSTYIGSTLSRYLKRRTLLLTSSTFANIFLFLTSFYLLLVRKSLISEINIVAIGLLAGYSLSISVGVIILCTTVTGELVALESRSLSVFVIAVVFKFMMAALVKTVPYVFKYCDIHGTFFMFAMCSTILSILIYIYLPETKDKTLEEIAESMNPRKSKGLCEIKKLIRRKGDNNI